MESCDNCEILVKKVFFSDFSLSACPLMSENLHIIEDGGLTEIRIGEELQ